MYAIIWIRVGQSAFTLKELLMHTTPFTTQLQQWPLATFHNLNPQM